jgi:hypothetical protein
MNKLSKNLLAILSGLALIIFPQLTFAEGEESTASEGGAAGDAASKSAIGGVSAGTIAAVVAIAAAAAAISDSGSGGGAITPTPTPTPTPTIEDYVADIVIDVPGVAATRTNGATATRVTGATSTRLTGATATRLTGTATRTTGATATRTTGATATRTTGATASRTTSNTVTASNGQGTQMAAGTQTNGGLEYYYYDVEVVPDNSKFEVYETDESEVYATEEVADLVETYDVVEEYEVQETFDVEETYTTTVTIPAIAASTVAGTAAATREVD